MSAEPAGNVEPLVVLWAARSTDWRDDAVAATVAGAPADRVAVGAPDGLAGVAKTYADGADVLAGIASDHSHRPLLLLRVGLRLPPGFERLLAAAGPLLADEQAVAFPGDHDARLDPFAGMAIGPLDPAEVCRWCGERLGVPVAAPSPACLLLPAGLASGRPSEAAPARALLLDIGYVRDPDAAAPEPGAPADPPHGHLRLRARALLEAGETALPPDAERPVTLHVAHGWGGGVWRWIDDLAHGDPDGLHLVLVAESDPDGRCCGRLLKLCVNGAGRGVVRELALSPTIGAVVDGHAGYREHLDALIQRFGVSRIVVSSLIGHSLDVLRTGLPTLVMLHDFFPLWPLLDRDPMPFVERADGDASTARREALQRHPDSVSFSLTSPEAWDRIAARWRDAVGGETVRLAAPTRHVVQRVRALVGERDLPIKRIAHGFRPFDGDPPAFEPPADAPLHLVIPGRLIAGKGLELLRQALPRLAGRVRLTALGCGRDGLSLMGAGGIDLVPEYRRDELPALVARLRPHAALLLSTVPETWSYTLSEMRALGLAPFATRIGAFAERIDDGRDGVLFDPEPGALVETVTAWSGRRQELAALAARAPRLRAPAEVAADIDRLAAAEPRAEALPRAATAADATASMLARGLADARGRLARAESAQADMRDELARRSRWAETMERQFRSRSAWAQRLEEERRAQDARIAEQAEALAEADRQYHELSDRHRELVDRYAEIERGLADARGRIEQLQAEQAELAARHDELGRMHQRALDAHDELSRRHQRLHAERDRLQGEYDRLVASRSWRLTRPLRFAARAARNARERRAFNPLRWPRLLARFGHHWRLRGLRQALTMLQSEPVAVEPAPAAPPPAAAPEADAPAEPVRLPCADDPVATVVVPVYNQLRYTAACLESLAAARCRVPFEVVVVDDASSDATPDWLARCEGIRFARNRENLGFIGTCNRGAAMARGRHLVFLNNDTRVTDDWLDALLQPLETRADVGVVGARLVYADGTLQEAGGIVFRDGSGWNYGRQDHPDRPEYGFVAEVDYVSGACLAIARATFEALDGFDRHFAPAYYEDTDLCFRVRARGLKVLYQPAATVTHFEGVTSGTDENAGAKRHQAVNRRRFEARWRDVLAGYPDNPGAFSRAAARALRDRRLPRRALVIDAVTPAPDQDSGSMRMFAMLELLVEMGFRTSFMPENLAWAGRDSVALQQAGVEVLTAPWLQDVEDWLAEHGAGLDLVVVSRHYVLAPIVRLIRALCPNARLVFDTVDLHYLREQREAELAGSQAAARAAASTRRSELALIGEADATLVVSEFERELLAREVPDARVAVVSNIHGVHGPGRPFEQREGLVFVGGFQHPPNLDAAEWLIDDILPRVRERLPDVELHLIGSKMPEPLRQRRAPGLTVHGFVADLEPFMTGCRVSVAPLRYGAGVKGKVNQAMSHGLPVVATSCAAEGMYTEHGRDVLVADDAAGFAEAVVRLYCDRDLWQALADNGRVNVETHFSVAAARRALEAVLDDLGMAAPGPAQADVSSVGAPN
jgi:GT2 family glycosyltransferase